MGLDELNTLLAQGRHVELRAALVAMNAVDVGQYMAQLPPEQLATAFRVLPKDRAAEVFSYMDADLQRGLIGAIGDREAGALIEKMFLDDAVDFLDELPADVVTRLLAGADRETRERVNQFLRYPANSAGAVMTIEYMELRPDMTAGQAMDAIRLTGGDKETIYVSYVVGDDRRLLGAVPIGKLLAAPADAPIGSVMERYAAVAHTLDDRAEAARTVRKYDLAVLPVLDADDRMVGVITADDVMDVMQQETTEDLQRMAAILPNEQDYLKTGVFRQAFSRIPWLMILMLSSTLTGAIISRFEGVIVGTGAFGIALIANLELLMDTSGDCGSQPLSLVVRSLALGEVRPADALKVLWKELRVGLMVGASLAVANFIRMLVIGNGAPAALAVSIALMLAVVLSKTLGAMLPLLATKLHLDPATAATPVLTTIVDACSLTVMFAVAELLTVVWPGI